MTGYASKAAEQAARIAGVLTLWRDLDASEVQAQDMADAITLAQFYLPEAARLADAATVSAEIDRAEVLRKWLLDSWPESDVLVRDMLRLAPSATCATSPPKNPPFVAHVARPLAQKRETTPYPDRFPHAWSALGNPITWTGQLVTPDTWRRLTEWERHGPDGRLWSGTTREWEFDVHQEQKPT